MRVRTIFRFGFGAGLFLGLLLPDELKVKLARSAAAVLEEANRQKRMKLIETKRESEDGNEAEKKV